MWRRRRAPLHRTELTGYIVWLVAGAIFAVPEIWASKDSDLPVPTLSGTVGHLERRWEIVSLLVILVIANALLHVVRVGAALLTQRAEKLAIGRGEVTAQGATFAVAATTVPLSPGKHLAVEDGRVTRTRSIHRLRWLLYFPLTLLVVALGFLLPLWVHNWHASDAEKQLSGEFGYGAMALMFFLIPGLVAYAGVLVPFPALFRTVVNLEQRAQIVAVLVAGCMTFLMLHLVFYPYPSIIPWFQNLEHLHNYCDQHAGQLICHATKKK